MAGKGGAALGDVAGKTAAALEPGDSLDRVLDRFDAVGGDLPVVDSRARLVGVVRREDALAAHNRALLRQHALTRGQT